MPTPKVSPGDIIAVRTTGWASEAIRLGAAVEEAITGHPEPNLDNHIAIAHHYDANGTLWFIEGRPGGIGWTSSDYTASKFAVTNALQPKTAEQRKTVIDDAPKLLGTAYDWAAIADDAFKAFGIRVPL
jgi:hypothetical protein